MIYRAHYLLTEYFIQFFAYHLTWRNQKGKKTENPVMNTLFTKFLILHLTIVSCFICTSKSKVKLQMSKPPGILNVWPLGMIFTFVCRPASPCSRVWEPPGRLEVFCKTFGALMPVESHVWKRAAASVMQFSMIGLIHITWNYWIIQTMNSIVHIST